MEEKSKEYLLLLKHNIENQKKAIARYEKKTNHDPITLSNLKGELTGYYYSIQNFQTVFDVSILDIN